MNYYGGKQMANSWRTVRGNTIKAAEEIPADQYGFRATPDTMSIGEMLAHMAASMLWSAKVNLVERRSAITGEDFGVIMAEAHALTQALKDKEAIIAALKEHGDYIAKLLESASDETLGEMVTLPVETKSRFEMLLGIKEHEMHHRAQIMLMQRMIGLVPHLTRARTERMAAMSAAAAANTTTGA